MKKRRETQTEIEKNAEPKKKLIIQHSNKIQIFINRFINIIKNEGGTTQITQR